MRYHGDYHLGQLLWVENTFIIIDFEGEPERLMAERRRKYSPLTDVAGMIRSFSHVAAVALYACTQTRPEDVSKLEPWAHVWQHWTTVHFLRSYLTTAAGAPFIPAEPRDLAILLEALLLEKVLEELHEALHHRLDWLPVPLQGLRQLLQLSTDTTTGG
jgi:maltose alpha-D-glucosyltransferase/alpha-amylase